MKAKLIYVTAADRAEAETIAETVVTEKLAACANIMDGLTSVFFWDGKLCKEQECLLILKAGEANTETLIRRIIELHSYDCPCVISLPIESGNPAFLQWLTGLA